MKRAIALAALMGLTVCASPNPPRQERMDAIWRAAYARMEKQNDYWFDEGDFPRIIHSLRLMNSVFPEDYEAATNLGWLLESTDQNDEALVVYIRFAKENPDNPDAAYPEANFYFMKRAYAKVPPIVEPSIKGRPPHPNSFRILAHAYEKLGMFKDSLRVWNALLALTPNDQAAKLNQRRVENKLKGEPPAPPPPR
jgi:tetratricopeptide (TPR) repeat protein